MDIGIIIGLVKNIPEGVVGFIALGMILVSFLMKQKDIDLGQVTTISKLHMEQLEFVINQNKTLLENNKTMAVELHGLRAELSEAYKSIDNMRERISELEDILKKTGK